MTWAQSVRGKVAGGPGARFACGHSVKDICSSLAPLTGVLSYARCHRQHIALLDVPRSHRRQGQFLAYIHHYSLVNGRPPAEADIQRFFRITPPSVHSMVLTLERQGFIRRVPGQPRNTNSPCTSRVLAVLETRQP